MTNDFPPRKGGIQTYLEGFARELDPDSLVVYCSSPPDGGADEYDAVDDDPLPGNGHASDSKRAPRDAENHSRTVH